jgi:hypothetical protein
MTQTQETAMPIYEFYCRDNHKIYQFYARTLAQGKIVPPCPDNPKLKMEKILSSFAVVGRAAGGGDAEVSGAGEAGGPDDARMEAAMGAMEREFSGVDENDPRSMGRMMRRMADLTGEKMDGEMEEVVRKLEEGADPDSLGDMLPDGPEEGEGSMPAGPVKEARGRLRARRAAPVRDPKLYDYP